MMCTVLIIYNKYSKKKQKKPRTVKFGLYNGDFKHHNTFTTAQSLVAVFYEDKKIFQISELIV